MKRRQPLTEQDHLRIGPALNIIRNGIAGELALKVFPKGRGPGTTAKHWRRSQRYLERLINQLDNLLYAENADAKFPPSPYYGNHGCPLLTAGPVADYVRNLREQFRHEVLQTINRHVPARMIDLGLNADSSMFMLALSLGDNGVMYDEGLLSRADGVSLGCI